MYTVTQLARAAGSTPDAVRHYTDIGLLCPQRDRGNNYRRYSEADRQRLLASWHRQPDCAPTGTALCHLIAGAEDGRHD